MKKFLTIISLIIISISGYAQRGGAPNWISIAAKGGYGCSALFCKQAQDINGFNMDWLAPSWTAGGRLGVVFIDKVGVSVEYLTANYQNKFDYNNNLVDLAGNFKMKSSDLLFLARYTGEYGFYCELGPKLTSVKDMTSEFEPEIAGMPGPAVEDNVTDKFKDKFTSVVFGFGFTPYNGDRVQVSLGVRAAYCPKNILNEGNDRIYKFGSDFSSIQNVEMKPFSAQIMLEVNYHFARFGSATCGKQRIIFFK